MRPITVTVGPLATAAANNIAASQSVTAGNSVIINGALATAGVATLDKPRRVLITSAGNDSGITFAIVGTNVSGNTISETLTGGNAGAVPSVLDYATVTSIKPSGATAAAITVGTNGVAASPWVRLDGLQVSQTGLQCDVSGTVNYTVQTSFDDPNSPTNPTAAASMTWFASSDAAVVNATTAQQSSFAYSPLFARVLLNSGTGSVTATFLQYGGNRS